MKEERPALDMVLHLEDDCPQKQLKKNGSFLPSNWPPHGTTAYGVSEASLNTHLQ